MEIEQNLIKLLFDKPNSKDILLLATKLESNSNFSLSKDIEKLKGIWELRWSSSNAPFLNYSPLVDNLQILDPLKSSAMNLLKPRGINAIVGTGIIAKLNPINEKTNNRTDTSTENVPSKKVEIIQIRVIKSNIFFLPCELSDFLPIHGPKIATITIAVEVAKPNC